MGTLGQGGRLRTIQRTELCEPENSVSQCLCGEPWLGDCKSCRVQFAGGLVRQRFEYLLILREADFGSRLERRFPSREVFVLLR